MFRLRVKRVTQDHAASKPDMFLRSEIKLGLTTLCNEDDDTDLIFKIGIAIMCFGAPRRLDMTKIEIQDIGINDLVSTDHPRKTKHRSKGFRLKALDFIEAGHVTAL